MNCDFSSRKPGSTAPKPNLFGTLVRRLHLFCSHDSFSISPLTHFGTVPSVWVVQHTRRRGPALQFDRVRVLSLSVSSLERCGPIEHDRYGLERGIFDRLKDEKSLAVGHDIIRIPGGNRPKTTQPKEPTHRTSFEATLRLHRHCRQLTVCRDIEHLLPIVPPPRT